MNIIEYDQIFDYLKNPNQKHVPKSIFEQAKHYIILEGKLISNLSPLIREISKEKYYSTRWDEPMLKMEPIEGIYDRTEFPRYIEMSEEN